MEVPTLVSDGICLRALRESDVPALARLHADPEVMRYLRPDGTLETRPRQAWDYIALHTGHWSLKGYGKWALADPVTDELIGRVGYFDAPYDWPGLELGWTLGRSVWGRGLATRAARLALDWGFEARGFDTVISAIHPDNGPSRRVAERLGMQHWRNGVIHGNACLIFGIDSAGWQSPPAK